MYDYNVNSKSNFLIKGKGVSLSFLLLQLVVVLVIVYGVIFITGVYKNTEVVYTQEELYQSIENSRVDNVDMLYSGMNKLAGTYEAEPLLYKVGNINVEYPSTLSLNMVKVIVNEAIANYEVQGKVVVLDDFKYEFLSRKTVVTSSIMLDGIEHIVTIGMSDGEEAVVNISPIVD